MSRLVRRVGFNLQRLFGGKRRRSGRLRMRDERFQLGFDDGCLGVFQLDNSHILFGRHDFFYQLLGRFGGLRIA